MRLRVLKPPSHGSPLLLRILRKAVQIFVDFTKMWYGLCPDGSRCGHIAQRSNIQLVPDGLCGYLSLVPGRPVRKDLRTHSIIFGVSHSPPHRKQPPFPEHDYRKHGLGTFYPSVALQPSPRLLPDCTTSNLHLTTSDFYQRVA